LVDDHNYSVEKVTFVEVPNFFGLYLEEHSYLLRFLFIRDTHAAVLVCSGWDWIGARNSQVEIDITHVVGSKNSSSVDGLLKVTCLTFHVVVSTGIYIFRAWHLYERSDVGHLIKAHPKQKSALFLTELLDWAFTLITSGKEKRHVVCAIIYQELGFFKAEEVCRFFTWEIVEFLWPVDYRLGWVENSDQLNFIVHNKRPVYILLAVIRIFVIKECSSESFVYRLNRIRGIMILQVYVYSWIAGLGPRCQLHNDWPWVSYTNNRKLRAISRFSAAGNVRHSVGQVIVESSPEDVAIKVDAEQEAVVVSGRTEIFWSGVASKNYYATWCIIVEAIYIFFLFASEVKGHQFVLTSWGHLNRRLRGHLRGPSVCKANEQDASYVEQKKQTSSVLGDFAVHLY